MSAPAGFTEEGWAGACALAAVADRRERIATAVYAAMLTGHAPQQIDMPDLAEFALDAADALVAALDAPEDDE